MMLLAAMLAMALAYAAPAMAQTGDRDCPDFGSQAEAQAAYRQDSSDPERLDGDDDGVACEDFAYPAGTPRDETPVGQATEPTQPPTQPTDQGQYPPATGTGTGELLQSGGDVTTTTTALPDTGGPSLLPIAGLLLVGTGLLGVIARRR
jgi:LPXTG-motif cell wall-anchored protein